jgi:hypothetical protein
MAPEEVAGRLSRRHFLGLVASGVGSYTVLAKVDSASALASVLLCPSPSVEGPSLIRTVVGFSGGRRRVAAGGRTRRRSGSGWRSPAW